MSNVRFGIIGCGTIAHFHARAIAACTGGTFMGVADVRLESAQRFAEEYAVKCYNSVDEMLQSDEIDAVCICTPSGFHAQTALQSIEAGKHILVEKPLAMTNEDCKKIITLAKEKNVRAGVISQYRFSPAIQELKQLVSEGKLGKIITADLLMKYYRSQEYYDSSNWRGTWKLDGGSLMNQGIHGVDALLYVMGPAKSVFGCARTLNHRMEAEDTAVATVEFENGALAVIQSTTSIYNGYPRCLTISGTKGTVTVQDDIITKCELDDPDYVCKTQTAAQQTQGFQDPKAISNDGHIFQIQDFINAIVNKEDPIIPLSQGYQTVAVINAVYTSSQTQQAVTLDRA